MKAAEENHAEATKKLKAKSRQEALDAKAARKREAALAKSLKRWEKPPTKVLEDVWTSASDESREAFIAIVAEADADGLDADVWGEAPTPEERRSVALEQMAIEFSRRAAVLEASLTASEVAELLHVSTQAIRDRIDSEDLLGLRDGRQWRLPFWQFSAEAERGFVPGIAELRKVFPGGLVSLSRWAEKPNPDLGDITPAQALAAGRVEPVVEAARVITAAAW